MNFLVSGLVLFFIVHLVPASPKTRETLIGKLKRNGYIGIFSVLSIVAVALIIYGLREATYQPIYEPLSWGRHAAMLLMLPAIYLFFSNSVGSAPSTARVITAHPMNWGVILWATGHLLANGDLAHVLLFGTFWIFSVISIVTGNVRGLKPTLERRPPIAREGVFLLLVLIVYAALLWGHPYFTGVPIIGA